MILCEINRLCSGQFACVGYFVHGNRCVNGMVCLRFGLIVNGNHAPILRFGEIGLRETCLCIVIAYI